MSDSAAIRRARPKVQPPVAQMGCSRAYCIVKQLPRELKGQLPSPAEISKLLEDVK